MIYIDDGQLQSIISLFAVFQEGEFDRLPACSSLTVDSKSRCLKHCWSQIGEDISRDGFLNSSAMRLSCFSDTPQVLIKKKINKCFSVKDLFGGFIFKPQTPFIFMLPPSLFLLTGSFKMNKPVKVTL